MLAGLLACLLAGLLAASLGLQGSRVLSRLKQLKPPFPPRQGTGRSGHTAHLGSQDRLLVYVLACVLACVLADLITYVPPCLPAACCVLDCLLLAVPASLHAIPGTLACALACVLVFVLPHTLAQLITHLLAYLTPVCFLVPCSLVCSHRLPARLLATTGVGGSQAPPCGISGQIWGLLRLYLGIRCGPRDRHRPPGLLAGPERQQKLFILLGLGGASLLLSHPVGPC